MLTSSISNTKWFHSVGESCNFMDSYILEFVLADVIANDFGHLVLFMADDIAMLPMILGRTHCRTHQHCDTILCWKCLRLTFSSDLEEAMSETGESLSSIKISLQNSLLFW